MGEKLTLTVLLAVALCAGGVLADVAGDFEVTFGAEARKVAASPSKTDDAAFAAKLLKIAKNAPDSSELRVLLCQKACLFGSAGPAGCDTAIEALSLLEEAEPDKKDQWRQRKFEVVKLRFDKSYGAAKEAAGQEYMESLEDLADAKVAQGDGAQAKKLYAQALVVAKHIKSDRAETILDKNKRANTVVAQQAKLKLTQAKLKRLQTGLAANPKNTTLRTELILLYVVEFDKPDQAAKLLTDDIDQATRTYVPLAAKDVAGLDEAICLKLGGWYYKQLLKKASPVGKPLVLGRAQGYYGRFAELHTTKDIQLVRAQMALASIKKELASNVKPTAASNFSTGKAITLNLGPGVTMKLVRIPSGKFMMGSPETEKGRRKDEGPQREVRITKAFYIGVTEVTQRQYESVTGGNPSKFPGPDNPAEHMPYTKAEAFCKALSKRTGLLVRMPTEAQWEYACRAGTTTRFSFGDEDKDFDAYGWCKANSDKTTHPVGMKKPNAAGLYDMHGNVAELCRDWYDEKFYANAKNVDPENTTEARDGVVRGGAWEDASDRCSTARRRSGSQAGRTHAFGFRVVVVSSSGAKR